MSGQAVNNSGGGRRAAAITALLTLAILGGTSWAYYMYYPRKIGPVQPIPFSHRIHAGEKKIGCIMCHTGAVDTARAGVPPLETCMLCHKRIITEHPQIIKLREHYEQGRPVEWVKVTDLPEYVYFRHDMHIRAGVDCGHCHGDVADMDRVTLTQDLTMGFCVQCHRDNNVSHDCLICHR